MSIVSKDKPIADSILNIVERSTVIVKLLDKKPTPLLIKIPLFLPYIVLRAIGWVIGKIIISIALKYFIPKTGIEDLDKTIKNILNGLFTPLGVWHSIRHCRDIYRIYQDCKNIKKQLDKDISEGGYSYNTINSENQPKKNIDFIKLVFDLLKNNTQPDKKSTEKRTLSELLTTGKNPNTKLVNLLSKITESLHKKANNNFLLNFFSKKTINAEFDVAKNRTTIEHTLQSLNTYIIGNNDSQNSLCNYLQGKVDFNKDNWIDFVFSLIKDPYAPVVNKDNKNDFKEAIKGLTKYLGKFFTPLEKLNDQNIDYFITLFIDTRAILEQEFKAKEFIINEKQFIDALLEDFENVYNKYQDSVSKDVVFQRLLELSHDYYFSTNKFHNADQTQSPLENELFDLLKNKLDIKTILDSAKEKGISDKLSFKYFIEVIKDKYLIKETKNRNQPIINIINQNFTPNSDLSESKDLENLIKFKNSIKIEENSSLFKIKSLDSNLSHEVNKLGYNDKEGKELLSVINKLIDLKSKNINETITSDHLLNIYPNFDSKMIMKLLQNNDTTFTEYASNSKEHLESVGEFLQLFIKYQKYSEHGGEDAYNNKVEASQEAPEKTPFHKLFDKLYPDQKEEAVTASVINALEKLPIEFIFKILNKPKASGDISGELSFKNSDKKTSIKIQNDNKTEYFIDFDDPFKPHPFVQIIEKICTDKNILNELIDLLSDEKEENKKINLLNNISTLLNFAKLFSPYEKDENDNISYPRNTKIDQIDETLRFLNNKLILSLASALSKKDQKSIGDVVINILLSDDINDTLLTSLATDLNEQNVNAGLKLLGLDIDINELKTIIELLVLINQEIKNTREHIEQVLPDSVKDGDNINLIIISILSSQKLLEKFENEETKKHLFKILNIFEVEGLKDIKSDNPNKQSIFGLLENILSLNRDLNYNVFDQLAERSKKLDTTINFSLIFQEFISKLLIDILKDQNIINQIKKNKDNLNKLTNLINIGFKGENVSYLIDLIYNIKEQEASNLAKLTIENDESYLDNFLTKILLDIIIKSPALVKQKTSDNEISAIQNLLLMIKPEILFAKDNTKKHIEISNELQSILKDVLQKINKIHKQMDSINYINDPKINKFYLLLILSIFEDKALSEKIKGLLKEEKSFIQALFQQLLTKIGISSQSALSNIEIFILFVQNIDKDKKEELVENLINGNIVNVLLYMLHKIPSEEIQKLLIQIIEQDILKYLDQEKSFIANKENGNQENASTSNIFNGLTHSTNPFDQADLTLLINPLIANIESNNSNYLYRVAPQSVLDMVTNKITNPLKTGIPLIDLKAEAIIKMIVEKLPLLSIVSNQSSLRKYPDNLEKSFSALEKTFEDFKKLYNNNGKQDLDIKKMIFSPIIFTILNFLGSENFEKITDNQKNLETLLKYLFNISDQEVLFIAASLKEISAILRADNIRNASTEFEYLYNSINAISQNQGLINKILIIFKIITQNDVINLGLIDEIEISQDDITVPASSNSQNNDKAPSFIFEYEKYHKLTTITIHKNIIEHGELLKDLEKSNMLKNFGWVGNNYVDKEKNYCLNLYDINESYLKSRYSYTNKLLENLSLYLSNQTFESKSTTNLYDFSFCNLANIIFIKSKFVNVKFDFAYINQSCNFSKTKWSGKISLHNTIFDSEGTFHKFIYNILKSNPDITLDYSQVLIKDNSINDKIMINKKISQFTIEKKIAEFKIIIEKELKQKELALIELEGKMIRQKELVLTDLKEKVAKEKEDKFNKKIKDASLTKDNVKDNVKDISSRFNLILPEKKEEQFTDKINAKPLTTILNRSTVDAFKSRSLSVSG